MSESEPVVEISKYPNRRYYDRNASRHITLEEIRTQIKEGAEVRISDSRTGTDITSKVLSQIILEFDSPKLDLLPPRVLTHVIRSRDSVVADFIENYVYRSFELFQQTQRQWEAATASPPSPFSAWTDAMMKLVPTPGMGSRAPQAGSSDLSGRIRDLEEQIAALKLSLKEAEN